MKVKSQLATTPSAFIDDTADLTPAERAAHVGRRKEIYEEAHPETRSTKAGGPGPGKGNQSQVGTDSPAPAFIDDTAAKTGKHRATVARDAPAREGGDFSSIGFT